MLFTDRRLIMCSMAWVMLVLTKHAETWTLTPTMCQYPCTCGQFLKSIHINGQHHFVHCQIVSLRKPASQPNHKTCVNTNAQERTATATDQEGQIVVTHLLCAFQQAADRWWHTQKFVDAVSLAALLSSPAALHNNPSVHGCKITCYRRCC